MRSGNNWTYTTEQVADGNYALKVKLASSVGLIFYRTNTQQLLDLRSYSHFEIKVKNFDFQSFFGKLEIYLILKLSTNIRFVVEWVKEISPYRLCSVTLQDNSHQQLSH
jgi:hypothetical protein